MAIKTLVPFCLDFDGTDDVVTATDIASIINLTELTWEYWVNRDTAGNQEMAVSKNNKWFQITTANKLSASYDYSTTDATATTNQTISIGV